LFYKNVRNPLHSSNYNKNIVNTLNRKPDAFWYFNNGVTAITELIPDIGQHAKKITTHGLQIINGAQTIYSVYQAYLNASEKDRKKMDIDARIMLRLIRSSDEDLNTEITKYTNSQNPLYNRDFFSNDDVQVRLQNASFETDYWYEKRRGEFRLEDKEKFDVEIVSNELMALAYMAFFKQHPVNAIMNSDKFFTSKKEDVTGLYEDIFNDATEYVDMLASFLMWQLILEPFKQENEDGIRSIPETVIDYLMPNLALSKIVLTKYLVKKLKPKKRLNIMKYIVEAFEKNKANDIDLFIKIIAYSLKKMQHKLETGDEIKSQEKFNKLMTNIVFYETIKTEIEESDLIMKDIEDIEIGDDGIKIPSKILDKEAESKQSK